MKKIPLLVICFALLLLAACKKWEDHVAISEQQLSETLMERIGKDAQLTTFADYIKQTGLDSLLKSSKNLTVFAPTNDALASLPASITSDLVQLKAYLQNHISAKAYFIRDAVDSLRATMLNTKRVFFINKKFDDANIIESDIYLSNGVLHKIDKVIAPMLNVWEYILATKKDYQQNNYIASLNYLGQDPNIAELDSINPNTGEPVYVPGTGIVTINTFKTKVLNVSNEDSLYTYIVLINNAFEAEKTRLLPYFTSRSSDTSANNAAWAVVKDFTIRGLYNEASLPSVLQSKFGVNIQMNKAAILSVKKLSNGIAYVMSAAPTSLAEKIPVVYVQGENPLSLSVNSAARIYYRQRMNPLTGQAFNDIYMNMGSGGANRYATYFSNDIYTTKYKVYLMSLNDRVLSGVGDDAYGTDSTLTHIVKVFNAEGSDSLLFDQSVAVTPNTYTEFYLGEFTNNEYNWLLSHPITTPDGASYLYTPATKYTRLIAPPSAVGRPINLTMNYLKFEPVFQ